MRRAIRIFLPVVWLGASSLTAGCGSDDVAAPRDAGPVDSSATSDGGSRDATVVDGGVADSAGADAGQVDANVSMDDGSADGGGLPSGEAGDGGGPLEFTVFAKQLILTQTMENNVPATTEDKTFIDTPPPGVFPPSFFP